LTGKTPPGPNERAEEIEARRKLAWQIAIAEFYAHPELWSEEQRAAFAVKNQKARERAPIMRAGLTPEVLERRDQAVRAYHADPTRSAGHHERLLEAAKAVHADPERESARVAAITQAWQDPERLEAHAEHLRQLRRDQPERWAQAKNQPGSLAALTEYRSVAVAKSVAKREGVIHPFKEPLLNDADWLRQRYCDDLLTLDQIAVLAGASGKVHVGKALKRAGIPARSAQAAAQLRSRGKLQPA
jgi:hypothetical protein